MNILAIGIGIIVVLCLFYFTFYAIISKSLKRAFLSPYYYFYILGAVINLLCSPVLKMCCSPILDTEVVKLAILVLLWHVLFCCTASNLFAGDKKRTVAKYSFFTIITLFLLPFCFTICTLIGDVAFDFTLCFWLLPISTFDPILYLLLSLFVAFGIVMNSRSLFKQQAEKKNDKPR